jgi:hypothetical protein
MVESDNYARICVKSFLSQNRREAHRRKRCYDIEDQGNKVMSKISLYIEVEIKH